jgi:hypothetical protein
VAIRIHPVDLPPKYYKPLGQIAAGWNLVEALVSSIIWHVHKIKSPNMGRLFTYRANSVEKLNMFKVTAENYLPNLAHKTKMLKLHKEADRLRGRRNTFVHGLWERMPKEHKIWKVFYLKSTDDTWTLLREVVALSDLTALATQIRQLNKDLKKFMVEIGAPPPP